MKSVAISGSTGFIGRKIGNFLTENGYKVIPIVRTKPSGDEIFFNPKRNYLDYSKLEGVDAIINLSGATIFTRWSEKNKQILRDSRINSTKTLVDGILKLKNSPKVFISASAVGIYGNRGDEILSEESSVFNNCFLSKLCLDWENEANLASAKNIRVVNLRLGLVLDPDGGVIKKMIPLFKLGLGCFISPTTQYMSWIDMVDLNNLIKFLLKTDISGPVNATSPNPVTNKEFSLKLSKTLKRPCIFTIPEFLINLVMGEAGKILIEGQRVVPKKALSHQLTFNTDLESAFKLEDQHHDRT